MHINKDDIAISCSFPNFKATWRDTCVGYVFCSRDHDRLKICDFKVNDKITVRWPFWHNLLVFLGIPVRKQNFQGLGVGTRMMTLVIEEAKKAGIQEIWGSVVQMDIEQTPNLLKWYEGQGYILLEPDEECLNGAIKKISQII
jgi:GNAT superfamily N-acetyltransferase